VTRSVWRGHNVTLPRMHDGVTPYAVPADTHSTADAKAWDRDSVKHLGAYAVARKMIPWADWYVMADDDTHYNLPQLKHILQSKQMRSLKSDFTKAELADLRKEFRTRVAQARAEPRAAGGPPVDLDGFPPESIPTVVPQPDYERVAALPEAKAKAKEDGGDPESITAESLQVEDDPDYPYANPAVTGAIYGLAGGIALAEACFNYQRQNEAYYVGAGAGVIMTRAAADLLVREVPYCSHRTANCWAGDRRLGSCLIDSGVKFVRDKLGGRYFGTRDVDQKYDEWNMPGENSYMATVHHLRGAETVLLPALEIVMGKDGMSSAEFSLWMDVLGEARSGAPGPPPLKRNRWTEDKAKTTTER